MHYASERGKDVIVKYLVEHGADINQKNDSGETPLCDTCKSGNKDLVQYLVEHGADIEQTALNISLREGYNQIAEYLEQKLAEVR